VRGSAVDAPTEVTLGAEQVVARVLPMRALTSVGRGRAQGVAGVRDGVVEAVGLDARGGLLPGAASAWLVGESAQRFGEVRSWSLERDTQVLPAAA
jgi:hypothetical protein